MVEFDKPTFDAAAFLMSAGLGRRIVQLEPKETFFSQGDPADSVLLSQTGRAKITVVSKAGKKHDRDPRPRRLCRRGGARSGARAAAILGKRHYRLHCAQDHAERDDPRHARGA